MPVKQEGAQEEKLPQRSAQEVPEAEAANYDQDPEAAEEANEEVMKEEEVAAKRAAEFEAVKQIPA